MAKAERLPKRMVWRNYVYTCRSDWMERCMEEVREVGFFERVHTPTITIKVRVGKERKREEREAFLLPGYFFARTKHWEPPVNDLKHAKKLLMSTSDGEVVWGWANDNDLARVTGKRVDRPQRLAPPKLIVGEAVLLNSWAFASMPEQRIIEVREGQGISLTSPLFGGVPLIIADGSSLSAAKPVKARPN
jgi:hypothetical protein